MTELADASSLEGALSVKPSTFLSSRSGGNKRCSKICSPHAGIAAIANPKAGWLHLRRDWQMAFRQRA